jgi:hypothetical protein
MNHNLLSMAAWQAEDVVFFLDYTGPAGLVQQAARLCHR